jgi:hypothetical protein
MHMMARWGLVVGVSAAAFVVSLWLCQEQAGLTEGAALGVTGAVLTLVLAAAVGWWAARDRPASEGRVATGWRVLEKPRMGRDANMAERDQTIISYLLRDE